MEHWVGLWYLVDALARNGLVFATRKLWVSGGTKSSCYRSPLMSSRYNDLW